MLQKRADVVFTFVLLLIVVWMVWQARGWSLGPRLFPWTIGIPAIVLGLVQLGFAIRNVRTSRAEKLEPGVDTAPEAAPPASPRDDADVVAAAVQSAFGAGSEVAAEEEIPPALARRRTLAMSAWILLFTVGVAVLGFRVGSGLLTLAFLRFGANESWKLSLAISLGTYLFFYLLFVQALAIQLPPGWLADTLGLDSFDDYLIEPIRMVLTVRG